jgi:hypothetical protein
MNMTPQTKIALTHKCSYTSLKVRDARSAREEEWQCMPMQDFAPQK